MMLSQCGNVVAFKFFNQDGFICFSFIRINKFFETDFTKKVNVKKQRRFDRSTVIFKLKSKNFCMRLKYIQSIIKMLMRYRPKL